MKVKIFNLETNLLLVEMPISFGVYGRKTNEQDLIDEVWLSAVEDKIVEEGAREKYKFLIVD